jgi:hypothetical protein
VGGVLVDSFDGCDWRNIGLSPSSRTVPRKVELSFNGANYGTQISVWGAPIFHADNEYQLPVDTSGSIDLRLDAYPALSEFFCPEGPFSLSNKINPNTGFVYFDDTDIVEAKEYKWQCYGKNEVGQGSDFSFSVRGTAEHPKSIDASLDQDLYLTGSSAYISAKVNKANGEQADWNDLRITSSDDQDVIDNATHKVVFGHKSGQRILTIEDASAHKYGQISKTVDIYDRPSLNHADKITFHKGDQVAHVFDVTPNSEANVSCDNLPAGLKVANQVITGTPEQIGTFTILCTPYIKLKNGSEISGDTKQITLEIVQDAFSDISVGENADAITTGRQYSLDLFYHDVYNEVTKKFALFRLESYGNGDVITSEGFNQEVALFKTGGKKVIGAAWVDESGEHELTKEIYVVSDPNTFFSAEKKEVKGFVGNHEVVNLVKTSNTADENVETAKYDLAECLNLPAGLSVNQYALTIEGTYATEQKIQSQCRVHNVIGWSNYKIYSFVVEQNPYSIYQSGKAITINDVSANSKYAPDIAWVLQNHYMLILHGHKFAPKAKMSYAELAQHLYLLAKKPAFVEPKESPFADLKKSAPEYKATCWAMHLGLLNVGKYTKHNPKSSELVVALAKMANVKKPSTANSIKWAKKLGFASSKKTFVERQAYARFVHVLAKKKVLSRIQKNHKL